MHAMVIVVGTSHTIQRTCLELKPFLESLCKDFRVSAVAEEMSKEALAEKDCVTSIPMQVASALQIPHRFCDPSRTERASLGIHQENDIRIHALLSNSILSESEIAAQVAESHARREQYWLEQLRNLNLWPVLFICGADHVTSFCKQLEQKGIAVQLVAVDWTANNTIKGNTP